MSSPVVDFLVASHAAPGGFFFLVCFFFEFEFDFDFEFEFECCALL